MMMNVPEELLKAVAALLSNMGGTLDEPIADPDDLLALHVEWDQYNGTRTALGIAPEEAAGHCVECTSAGEGVRTPAYYYLVDETCVFCGCKLAF